MHYHLERLSMFTSKRNTTPNCSSQQQGMIIQVFHFVERKQYSFQRKIERWYNPILTNNLKWCCWCILYVSWKFQEILLIMLRYSLFHLKIMLMSEKDTRHADIFILFLGKRPLLLKNI